MPYMFEETGAKVTFILLSHKLIFILFLVMHNFQLNSKDKLEDKARQSIPSFLCIEHTVFYFYLKKDFTIILCVSSEKLYFSP